MTSRTTTVAALRTQPDHVLTDYDRLFDLVCVQNKTVVTDAFKGEDLNGYVPIFDAYGIPVLYNFKDEDMRWVRYEPKARMRVLDKIFPHGIHVPDYFFGKNILHLP